MVTGGAASLSISLLGSSTEPEKKVDTKKPANFDLIVRETDKLYEVYLIDNAYAILRKLACFSL